MKNLLNYLTVAAMFLLFHITANAQLAYMPSPLTDDQDLISIEIEDETPAYNREEVKDYLPFENENLFGGNEEEEDISNYLPLASPLFGQEVNDADLPLDSGNGYFLETGEAYTESSYAVFADNNFKEIVISFDASKEESIQVNLLNTVGVTIRHETYAIDNGFDNFSLDIEDLPRGLYTLKLTGNTQNVIKKFVIK